MGAQSHVGNIQRYTEWAWGEVELAMDQKAGSLHSLIQSSAWLDEPVRGSKLWAFLGGGGILLANTPSPPQYHSQGSTDSISGGSQAGDLPIPNTTIVIYIEWHATFFLRVHKCFYTWNRERFQFHWFPLSTDIHPRWISDCFGGFPDLLGPVFGRVTMGG